MTISELINRLLEYSVEPNSKVINAATGTELKGILFFKHQDEKFPMEVHLRFYEEVSSSKNIFNMMDKVAAQIENPKKNDNN
jgi:hypothetical protein